MRKPGPGWIPGEPFFDRLERQTPPEQGEAWGGVGHVATGPGRRDAGDAAWRGDEHFDDWPEAQAGPEYWMYKQAAEDA